MGDTLALLSPTNKFPSVFDPQHLTLPVLSSAHVLLPLTAIMVALALSSKFSADWF
jgi:hypothetical protein